MVKRKLGVARVVDLSATPFFLRGSGYAEGTLFPWTMSDFSLMDAIECGIVKLPRVPVADNIPGADMPMYRNLWEHIRTKMPKKGRGTAGCLDPLSLPPQLQTALEALYGHYEKTFKLWEEAGLRVPPCFIVVCNNTSTSKLVYDFISGFYRVREDESSKLEQGRLPLFRNFDEHGNPRPRPNTLLIDSEQLESGEALDTNFRDMATDEIERFRREIVECTGDRRAADDLSDQALLREVMNTVGKHGRLGASIRCVVSVSMLTEGWDANTATHVLGVRAFGTQLLCEQVIGRALRRQSYELNAEDLFDVEYADVLGIPFDFTAKPVVAPPQKPRETIQVRAVHPDRDALEIRFPRVEGYRIELPNERLTATFDETSVLDSDWEAEFCRVVEAHPRVYAYVKNHNLGFEIPYRYGSELRRYRPDFIVLVDDGRGADDLLHLIVEIKGFRREDAKDKQATVETYWLHAVNNLGAYGRWDFAEFGAVYAIEAEFDRLVASRIAPP
jgi:type III restriction enzyme